ncbi:aminoglycoside phosphotransferase [Clostridiaceae bacterium M8S5]|nr:aminoglycoside phosphotransferase [Clostridiaceae bacterium M8S5]
MHLDKKIGTGAQADVYLHDNKAIKLFKKGYSKSQVFYEAMINSIVENIEIPVASVHEVLKIDGRFAISMDYVQGVTLYELFEKDNVNPNKYIEIMVDLQIKVQSQKVVLPVKLKDRLKNQIIENKEIDKYKKQNIIELLGSFDEGDNLCHGDFHWYNIIKGKKDFYVIDWIDATVGCKEADACRTYMLYLFHCSEYAQVYLSTYCEKTGKDKDDILKWLPVIAAARLNGGFEEEREKINLIIKDI